MFGISVVADIPALTPVYPFLPWAPIPLLCFFSLDPALLSSAMTVWLAGSVGNGQALFACCPQEPPSCLPWGSWVLRGWVHTGCLELPRGRGGLGQSDLNPDSPGSAPAQASRNPGVGPEGAAYCAYPPQAVLR